MYFQTQPQISWVCEHRAQGRSLSSVINVLSLYHSIHISYETIPQTTATGCKRQAVHLRKVAFAKGETLNETVLFLRLQPFHWEGQLPLHSGLNCLKLRSHEEKPIVFLPSHCGNVGNSTPRNGQSITNSQLLR